MAPTIGSEQSAISNTADIVLTLAAGTTVGDLAVLICINDFYAATNLQTPTGTAVAAWTLRHTMDLGTDLAHAKVWTGAVTTGGASTIDTNWSTTDEERYAQALIIQNGAYDTANSANTVATTTSWVAPTVTPTGPDDLLVCSWGFGGGGGDVNLTVPGSMTGLTERDSATNVTYRSAYEFLGSSAATGTRTATSSVSMPNSFGLSVLIKSTGAAPATASSIATRDRPLKRRLFR